jgi:hypothetical protein
MAGEIHHRGVPKTRGIEPELRRRRLLAARRYGLNSVPRIAILLGHWDRGDVVRLAGEPLGPKRGRKRKVKHA